MDPCSDLPRDDTKDLLWGIEMDQLKAQQLESRMDPCSDQPRDDTKDLLWGTEMDPLKAQRMDTLTMKKMETRMIE